MDYQFKNFTKFILPAIFSFVFLALAGEAEAETYYISPTGNDSASGAIGAPWLTIQTSENKLSDWDTLVFRGGTYTPQRVVVSGNNITFRNYTGETPIIDCTFTFPTGDFDKDTPAPTPYYTAIVEANGNAFKIDGIHIQKCRGIGIDVMDATNSQVLNCVTDYTYAAGIKLGRENKVNNNLAENNIISFPNHVGDTSEWNEWSSIGQGIHIQGINNTIRGNTVRYSRHAGIETYLAKNALIENNIVYGNRGSQLHIESSANGVIRNNLIYGCRRPGLTSLTEGFGTGISLMCELWYDGAQYSFGNRVYGNFIANTKLNLQLSYNIGKTPSTHLENVVKGSLIFNNTFVESSAVMVASQVHRNIWVNSSTHLGTGNQIKNNIFFQVTGDQAYGSVDAAKTIIDFNLWNKTPNIASFKGTHDPGNVSGTYPTLSMASYLTKSSGWTDITGGSITENAFYLRSSATNALNTGTWIATTTSAGSGTVIPVTALPTGHRGYFHTGDVIQFQGQTGTMTVVSSTNSTITVASSTPTPSWSNNLGLSLAYSGSRPDIGAYEYSSGDPTPPARPSGLGVR